MWWRKKADRPEPPALRCSFCNKLQDDVPRLIAGPRVLICDECVEVCNDIIADDERFEKQAGKTANRRTGGSPMPWPNMIPCALCRVAIPATDGFVIENRGFLCAGCVNAVQALRVNGQ